jgi:hypothetical protein
MILSFSTRVVLGFAGAVLALGSGVARGAEEETTRVEEQAGAVVAAGPSAERLKALERAEEAELWLEQAIPVGFTVGEAPEFFEAADEVFFEAGEGLHVFAYRSAETGRWIAWVAFDADRSGVIHTAAIELDR